MERVNEGGSPLTMLSHMIEASERIVTQIVEETKENSTITYYTIIIFQ